MCTIIIRAIWVLSKIRQWRHEHQDVKHRISTGQTTIWTKKYRFTFCIHREIWSRHQKITFQDMIVAFLWDNTRRWAIEREIMTRCPRGTDDTWANNTSMTRDEINWKRLAKQDNARFVNHLKTGAGQKMKVLEAKLDGKLCVNWCYFLAYIYFDLCR